MYNNLTLPTVYNMGCREGKVEEKQMRQMSLEQAGGLDWKWTVITGERPKLPLFSEFCRFRQ